MRKTDLSYLGEGFSALHFWVFNACMTIAWLALRVLALFAGIGINYIFTIDPTPVSTSVTGQLGCAFISLMYGLSVLAIATVILTSWLFGNIYILRKELYELAKRLFRWGDL